MNTLDDARPFPGLRPFSLADAPFFFGRAAHVADLGARMVRRRFVAVVGRSGEGKSSLVFAGLLPGLLREKGEGGAPRWRHGSMRPGGAPMVRLAEMVDAITRPAEDEDELDREMRLERIAARLRRSSFGLAELLGEDAEGRPILLIVDQFEELFRFDRQKAGPQDFEEAAVFVDLLLQASQAEGLEVHVVLTMRSEYLGDCPRFRGLAAAINDSQFLTPRLSRAERRLAIEGPVEKAGASIDPALVQRLLNDVGDAPDMLPVLAHVMMRAWAHASLRTQPPSLRMKDYGDVGEIELALSDHADTLLETLDPPDRVVAEEVFKALAEVDADGRIARRTPQPRFRDLVRLTGGDEMATRRAIDAFRGGEANFLSPFEVRPLRYDDPVDVSHEALIRRWTTMAGWVKTEQNDARRYRALLDSLGEGKTAARSILPTAIAPERLNWWRQRAPGDAWAARYGGRFDEVSAFMDRSRAYLRKERARKLTPWVLGGALVLAIGTVQIMFEDNKQQAKALVIKEKYQQQLEAEQKQTKDALEDLRQAKAEVDFAQKEMVVALEEARVALAKFRIEEELRNRAETDREKAEEDRIKEERARQIEQARRLAVEAMELVAQGDIRLAAQVTREAMESELILPSTQAAAYSALTTRYWEDLETPQKIAPSTVDYGISGFSPDGDLLYAIDSEGLGVLWNARDGEPVTSLMPTRDDGFSFSPNGELLIFTSDGAIASWSRDINTEKPTIPSNGISSATFSPDGAYIATVPYLGYYKLWDAQTGVEYLRLTKNWGGSKLPVVSPDGTRVLLNSMSGEVTVWNVETKRRLYGSAAKGFKGFDASFSPDSTRIIAAGLDGSVTVWDAREIRPLLSLKGLTQDVDAAVFSPDGTRILTRADDFLTLSGGAVKLWDLRTGEELINLSNDTTIDAQFSPDSKSILTFGGSSMILTDAKTGESIVKIFGDRGAVMRDAAFSPDSKRIFTTWGGTQPPTLWDAKTGGEVARLYRDGWFRGVSDFNPQGCVRRVRLNGERADVCQITLLDPPPRAVEGRDAPSWLPPSPMVAGGKDADGSGQNTWVSPDDLYGAELIETSVGYRLVMVDRANDGILAEFALPASTGPVRDVLFEPDGGGVLVLSDRLALWRASEGGGEGAISSPVARFDSADAARIAIAAFSPDGTQVSAWREDGYVTTWPVFSDADALRDALAGLDLRKLSLAQGCDYGLRPDEQCAVAIQQIRSDK